MHFQYLIRYLSDTFSIVRLYYAELWNSSHELGRKVLHSENTPLLVFLWNITPEVKAGTWIGYKVIGLLRITTHLYVLLFRKKPRTQRQLPMAGEKGRYILSRPKAEMP